jgi:hypothetical protein
MDNPHTGSTYTSSTVMGEFCINDVTCDISNVSIPMVWLTMFLLLANFQQIQYSEKKEPSMKQ